MRIMSFTAAAIAGILATSACATDHVTSGEPGEPSPAEVVSPPPPPPPPPPAPPPAPPPPPPVSSAPSAEGVTVTGSIADRTEGDAATIAPEPEKPLPQSGTLTAGDYDDVLNPGLYKSYVKKALSGGLRHKGLPYVDAAQRVEIRVTDRLGKPAPFVTIEVLDDSGSAMFPLRTGAKGTAYLYPNFDALGDSVTLRAVPLSGADPLTRKLDLGDGQRPDRVTLSLPGDADKVTKLDLLLTIDATGSMSDEMRYLQSELLSILGRIKDSQGTLDIHAGLIAYRDKGDAYVVRDFDFTGDLDAFAENLRAQSADGGGDFPEAMQDAMTRGLEFSWREDAVKVNMLVADAPPHDQDIGATWDSALISRTRGIHIVPLAASGIDDTAEFLMRAMGQATGGRYLFLTDDSGVGNAHAEPTVDCYVVTRLDGLVERVLTDLITGQRVEPDGDAVIRVVGDYKAGICNVEGAES